VTPTYRIATLEDHAGITEVWMAVTENRLRYPFRVTHADYVAYITEVGRGWVAEIDGEIIGFSFANRSGLIWALFLRPGFEGRGIGKKLLGFCLDWLREIGVDVAFLDTGAGTRAETFYRRQGWRETARDGDSIAFARELGG
jgi:GNAT superfamily N-acetyltransferase